MNTQELEFAIACIGAIAKKLGKKAKDVYNCLDKSGILKDYIIPRYDILHTFSRDYMADDVISLMKKKGISL